MSDILTIPIEKVKEWDKNPRGIIKQDFERLKKHLKKYGQYKPLICFKQNGKYITLGGNMRLKAMQALNISQVKVLEVIPKNKKEKIELSLIDNDRVGYYEEQALAELIYPFKDELDLGNLKVDLKVPNIDLGNVLDRYAPSNEKDDEIPEVKKTNIKLGDLFQLGNHRLLCGDATKKEDVERLMDGKKADMVLTDPPYRLSGEGFGYRGDRHYGKLRSDKIFDYKDWLDNVELIAKENFNILVFEFWKNVIPLWQALERCYKVKSMIIWHATNRYTFPHKFFSNRYDICLYATRGNYYFDLPRDKGSNPPYDFIDSPPETEKTTGQSEVFGAKPICILTPYIKPLCSRTGIVLDLFLGSGSTLIACEKTNRLCCGMEVIPLHCQVIIDRWQNYTGQKVVKIG